MLGKINTEKLESLLLKAGGNFNKPIIKEGSKPKPGTDLFVKADIKSENKENETVSFNKEYLDKLVKELDNNKFTTREKASNNLFTYLEQVNWGDLYKTIAYLIDKKKGEPLEVRKRIERSIEEIPKMLSKKFREDEKIYEEFLKLANVNEDELATKEIDKLFKKCGENATKVFELLIKENLFSDKVNNVFAKSKNLSTGTLDFLSKSGDVETRASVAFNKNTALETIKKLLTDKDQRVKYSLAKNPQCTKELFEKLATDKDTDVRVFLGGYKNTPIDILRKLANDNSTYVKREVFFNTNTPKDLKEQLIKDPDNNLRERIAWDSKDSKVLEMLSKDPDNEVRKAVTRNEDTKPDILSKLAKDEDDKVRQAVATNKNTPLEALKILLKDPLGEVIEKAILNPKLDLTQKELKDFAKHISRDVRSAVAKHKNTSIEILIELSKDSDYLPRASVAENENTPENILNALSDDTHRVVRQHLVSNRKTPIAILKKFTFDTDPFVRNWAIHELKARENK